MPSRFSRTTLLLILAALNLVFWILVAAATGLMVSREVDLGLETLLREQQATAAVLWKEAVSKVPKGPAQQTSAATPPASATASQSRTVVAMSSGTEAAPPEESRPGRTPAAQSAGAAGRETAMTPYTSSTSPSAGPTPLPTLRVDPTQAQTPEVAPTTAPASAAAATELRATPISSPLLLADFELGNLANLHEEMSRSAIGRAVQIRYSEAMLNQELESLLLTRPDLPYREVEVDLKRDQAVLTGNVLILGFDVSTEVVSSVVVENCVPRIEAQSISIAGVLTPGFVKERVREIVGDALSWYQADYPLCLDQIVLEEERATLYGHRR